MRDLLLDIAERRMGDLSDRLASGALSLSDWQIGMRQELRDAYAMQIVAAADGDKANVSADDWLRLGSQLRSQYGYLEDFAHSVQAGDVTGDAIGNRATMYARSAKQMYWRQTTAGVDLPAYPNDGSTPCSKGGNCGCGWRDNGDGTYSWERSKADSCDDCIWREEHWNPYVPEAVAA